jgi:membrane protease YdiL (CAAX protease family)
MPQPAPTSHLALIGEMVLLFVLLPLAFRFRLVPLPPIPALWLLMAYCLYRLLSDVAFNRKKLWNQQALPASVWQIITMFAAGAVVVGAGVYFLTPGLLFDFVRRTPAFWALMMVFYPVLSVYPQGIVYRAFFFERYGRLFPRPAVLIAMSAVAFSFAHIIFRNPIAVSFTLVGGLLFAWRYAATGSLLTSSLEHALYGCWMFTIGLGDYFYKGAR